MSYINPDRCDPKRPDEAAKVDSFMQGFLDGQDRVKREAILRGIRLVSAVYEGAKAAGTEGAPEGALYAAAMQKGYTLDNFTRAVHLLETRKLIRRSHYRLFAVELVDKIESGLGPEENH